MDIPKSGQRQAIDDLIDTSIIYAKTATGQDRLFDEIGKLPGISISERRKFQEDRVTQYDCRVHTFAVMMGEHRGMFGDVGLHMACWLDTENFLRERGYKRVVAPWDQDVVTYKDPAGNEVMHFGVYRGGKVTSKFYHGHVFVHEICMVPNRFGEEAQFFRKI